MYEISVKNEKLLDAMIGLAVSNTFYYDILLYASFREVYTPEFTAAVSINRAGSFVFHYNPKFLEPMNSAQISFVIVHEVQHFLSNHIQRAQFFGHDPRLSNIAQDMIINTNIKDYHKSFEQPTAIIDGKVTPIGVYIPEDYDEERISEVLYEWLQKKHPEWTKQTVTIQFSKDGEKGEVTVSVDSKGNVYIDKEEINAANGASDEVSQEVKDSIIKDVISRAQNRGHCGGDVEKVLMSIRRSKKNYLSILKSAISSCVGSTRQSSWKRLSKKYDLAPGYTRERNELMCILDVSGSMDGLIEKALSYIFHNGIVMNIVQCDTRVNNVEVCNSLKDIQKMKIKGFGGTELQPAINFISSNKKYSKLPLVVLTDGYCDTLNFDKVKSRVLAISVGTDIPTEGAKKITKIKVEK